MNDAHHGTNLEARARRSGVWIAAGLAFTAAFGPAASARAADSAGKGAHPAELERGASPAHWTPIADDVYLQENAWKIPTDAPVLALGALDGIIYAGMEDGLHRIDGAKLIPVDEPGAPASAVLRLKRLKDALYATCEDGLHRLRDGKWFYVSEFVPNDLTLYRGQVVAAVGAKLMTVFEDGLELLEPVETFAPSAPVDPVGGKPNEKREHFTAIEGHVDSIYGVMREALGVYDGREFDWANAVDWGKLPGHHRRDLLSVGSRLFIATDDGLAVLRGLTLRVLRGPEGMPVVDTTCLAEGFGGDVWIGTNHGAVRALPDGTFQYLARDRWMPGTRVLAIEVSDHTVAIATEKGIGVIEYIPFTLAKKAAWYEAAIERLGMKRMGFVHMLEQDKRTGEWHREISDNDGGWTSEYMAAMSFKFAVTGDEAARLEAVRAFRAVNWLREITPIEGFPARAIWIDGQGGRKPRKGSGNFPAEWHRVPGQPWQWKGDTSSDEVDSHLYGTALFYELAARGAEKDMAREHIDRIASHIIDNGWILKDLDGKPTRWGRWDEEYFTGDGIDARGLNGIEALSFMSIARAVTGKEKYASAARELLGKGYADQALRQKYTFPPDNVVPWDDQLAYQAYYNLIPHETNAALRSLYRRSIERSQEIKRPEANPWNNFVYAALTGSEFETDRTAESLRAWPLDLMDWKYKNSDRADLILPPGEHSYSGETKALSSREIGPARWDSSWFRRDGGNNRGVIDPSGWIQAYWMGRYYGFIKPPAAETAAPPDAVERVAMPSVSTYDGPKPDWLIKFEVGN